VCRGWSDSGGPLVRYGSHADQVANLHRPAGDGGPWPCIVLIHGGFWRDRWDRTLMTPLAIDLARRGYAVWNVEYRRVGQEGGGWPGTLDDVGAAADALASVPEVDVARLVALGHSAGGQLALWLGGRATGLVRMHGVVSLAGVADLALAHAQALGEGAVADFLGGGPDQVPDRYADASPAARVPLGVGQLLLHGREDDVVPPSQSRAHYERARAAGDDVELVEIAGADHFDVVDPAHDAWQAVVERLPCLVGSA
jgi:acetyl esterase/lipase